MKFKSLTSNLTFPLFALSLPAGLLFVCADIPVKAQQSSPFKPSIPPANKPETHTLSRKDSKAPVAPPKSGDSLVSQMAEELLTTRNTLQRQLAEAIQEEQSLLLHFAILQKKNGAAQPQPDARLRAQNLRQLEEAQVKIASKQVFIFTLKQQIEQNTSIMQSLSPSLFRNKPGTILPPQEPGVEGRTLLFTPTDKAKLVKRNLLFTPEDQKRVKFLPKSDERMTKP